MALDFQQVREQVRQLGENATLREQQLRALREQAEALLAHYGRELEQLREKVQDARRYDPGLRCALPVHEPLDGAFPTPPLPEQVTLVAADGSQINPDRHAEVDYGLINVGAIQMCYGQPATPLLTTTCHLLYGEEFYTPTGSITDARLALLRDFHERKLLADLAEGLPAPVITFADGQMELWGGKDSETATEFQRSLAEYKEVLARLHTLQVITAGYVDKPGANLVVRLLEVAETAQNDLPRIRDLYPLSGVTDLALYQGRLGAGARSAVFALQSQAAGQYTGPLALHFFYLNVGRDGHPWLARVDIPAWVADDPHKLDALHSVLVHQCAIMGTRSYPYLLHRAHETAVVTLPEKEQVTQMIALELRRRGVAVGELSHKQGAKDLPGRTRLL